MTNKRNLFVSVLVLALALTTACGSKQEAAVEVVQIIPTNTPEPTEIPKLMPGEPTGEVERTLEDTDASIKAEEKRAVTGDNILNNLYERPFTSEEMEYQPDLNILTVSITADDFFFYFTIDLEDVDPTSGDLTGTYGIEFDRTLSGRGDLLVWVSNPGAEWSTDHLSVYVDETARVGGFKPVEAEEDYPGEGYISFLELYENHVAWARLAPEDPSTVQIAVSHALLEYPEEFLWGAWADGGVRDPGLFDYNDHFGTSEAGSPINTDPDYPLKALYSLDNTCRLPHGLDQMSSSVPGMCISIQPGVNCVCTYWVNFGATRVCVLWDCD